ncbi:MAG TPA: AraC family transcriptional regulator [Puia sp.]|jgi:AraC-like DNA-binding protein/quercetin dioxygenase-like cupin family protein|nr:AraC family transcriptional regulator [Puia sp.]
MLKASFEVLHPPAGNSFLLKVFGELAFTAPYHFHPEYELTLITEGKGKRYVGNHMADFNAGDLVLIGPHLPHCWKLETPAHPAGAIVIQFAPGFLGEDFFSKAEFGFIRKLLQNSGCGIQFPSSPPDKRQGASPVRQQPGREIPTAAASLTEQVKRLSTEKNDFRKLIGLLEILQELALNRNAVLLDTRRTTAELPPIDRERIHPIFAYLVENFRGEVSLDSAAAAIGMTPNAFCRYFKKITRKTFMETVIEYRLNYATHQLVQTDKSISAICFDSGFGDISHFYKMFRSRMQVSPLNYRRQFMQETTKK